MSGLSVEAQAAVVRSKLPPLRVLIEMKHNYRPWLLSHVARNRVENLRVRAGDAEKFNPLTAYSADRFSAEVFLAVYRPNAVIVWDYLSPEVRADIQTALSEGQAAEEILACPKALLPKIAKQIRAAYGFHIPSVPPKSTMGITATRVLDMRSQGKSWDQIADIFGVSSRTMYAWRNANGFGARDGHSDCAKPRAVFRANVLRAFRESNTAQELAAEVAEALRKFQEVTSE